MNIVFIGTAEFACPSLEALGAAREHSVLGVVTQPDRPAGRKMILTPPPVKQVALKHHFRIVQPERVKNPAFIQTLGYLGPELIVVVAYGQILPAEILAMPKHGCINVHASLLPRYRGASPIQAALLNGDAETGVTTMFMDAGLDTGDIILQSVVAIDPADNAAVLHDRLANDGAKLLLKTLELLAKGKAPRIKQNESQATVCKKLRKEDGRIDWKLDSRELANRVRAFNPWPGAFCQLRSNRGRKLVKIWGAEVAPERPHTPGIVVAISADGIDVATGSGCLRIKELQMEGGRKLYATDFVRGHDVQVGTIFE